MGNCAHVKESVLVRLPWSVLCRQVEIQDHSLQEARAVTGVRVLPVVGVRVSITHVDASAVTR